MKHWGNLADCLEHILCILIVLTSHLIVADNAMFDLIKHDLDSSSLVLDLVPNHPAKFTGQFRKLVEYTRWIGWIHQPDKLSLSRCDGRHDAMALLKTKTMGKFEFCGPSSQLLKGMSDKGLARA